MYKVGRGRVASTLIASLLVSMTMAAWPHHAAAWQDFYSPPSEQVEVEVRDTMGPKKVANFRVSYEITRAMITAGPGGGKPGGVMTLTWDKPDDQNYPSPVDDPWLYLVSDVADGPDSPDGGDAYYIYRAVNKQKNKSSRPRYNFLATVANKHTTTYADDNIVLGRHYLYMIIPFDIFGNSGAVTESREDPANDTLTMPDYIDDIQARMSFRNSEVEINFSEPRTQAAHLNYQVWVWREQNQNLTEDITNKRVLSYTDFTEDGVTYLQYDGATLPASGGEIFSIGVDLTDQDYPVITGLPAGHEFRVDGDAPDGLVRFIHIPPLIGVGSLGNRYWAYLVLAVDSDDNVGFVPSEGGGLGNRVYNGDFSQALIGWDLPSGNDYNYLGTNGSILFPYADRGVTSATSAVLHSYWCVSTSDAGKAYHYIDPGDLSAIRSNKIWLQTTDAYAVGLRPGDSYTINYSWDIVGSSFILGETMDHSGHYLPTGVNFDVFTSHIKFYNGYGAGGVRADRFDLDWDLKRQEFTAGTTAVEITQGTQVNTVTIDDVYTSGSADDDLDDVYSMKYLVVANNHAVRLDSFGVYPEKLDTPTCIYVYDNTPPTKVRDLRASGNYNNTRITLTWTEPVDDSGISKYIIYRTPLVDGGEWETITDHQLVVINMSAPPSKFLQVGTDITYYDDTAGSLVYFYAMVAYDASTPVNISDLSNISKARPSFPFDLSPPGDAFLAGTKNVQAWVYYPNSSIGDTALPINPSAGDISWNRYNAADDYNLDLLIRQVTDQDGLGGNGIAGTYHLVRRKFEPVGNRMPNYGYEDTDMTGWDFTDCGDCGERVDASSAVRERLFGEAALHYSNTGAGVTGQIKVTDPYILVMNNRTSPTHGLYYEDKLTLGAWVLMMPVVPGGDTASGTVSLEIRFKDMGMTTGPVLKHQTYAVEPNSGWNYIRMEIPETRMTFEDITLDTLLTETAGYRTWTMSSTGTYADAHVTGSEKVEHDDSHVAVEMSTPGAENDVRSDFRLNFQPFVTAPQSDVDISFRLYFANRLVKYELKLTNYDDQKPVQITFESDYDISYLDQDGDRVKLSSAYKWHEETWQQYRMQYKITGNTWSFYQWDANSSSWLLLIDNIPSLAGEFYAADMLINALLFSINGEGYVYFDDLLLFEGGFEDLEVLIGATDGIGDFYMDNISLDNGYPVWATGERSEDYLYPTGIDVSESEISNPAISVNVVLDVPAAPEHGDIEANTPYYYAIFASDIAGFPAIEELNPHLVASPLLHDKRNEGRIEVNTRIEKDTIPPEFKSVYIAREDYWYDINYPDNTNDNSGFDCSGSGATIVYPDQNKDAADCNSNGSTATVENQVTSHIAFEYMMLGNYGIGNKYRDGTRMKVRVNLDEYILNGGNLSLSPAFDSGDASFGSLVSVKYLGHGEYELVHTISGPSGLLPEPYGNVNGETNSLVQDTDTRQCIGEDCDTLMISVDDIFYNWNDLDPAFRRGDSVTVSALDAASNKASDFSFHGWLDNTPPSWSGYDSDIDDFQWKDGSIPEQSDPGIGPDDKGQYMRFRERVLDAYGIRLPLDYKTNTKTSGARGTKTRGMSSGSSGR